MIVLHSDNRLLRKCIVWGMILLMLCCCTGKPPEISAPEESKVEASDDSLAETVRSYQNYVCGAKYLDSQRYVCLESGESSKPGPWKSYLVMGSVCLSLSPGKVEVDTENRTAEVESTLEQHVYPPVGSGNPLHRWLTIQETWKQVEGKWCVEDGRIIGKSLTPPDNESVSTSG